MLWWHGYLYMLICIYDDLRIIRTELILGVPKIKRKTVAVQSNGWFDKISEKKNKGDQIVIGGLRKTNISNFTSQNTTLFRIWGFQCWVIMLFKIVLKIQENNRQTNSWKFYILCKLCILMAENLYPGHMSNQATCFICMYSSLHLCCLSLHFYLNHLYLH